MSDLDPDHPRGIPKVSHSPGFAGVVQREIAPLLPALEASRRRRLSGTLIASALILIACAVVAAMPMVIGDPTGPQIRLVVAIACAGGLLIAGAHYWQANKAFLSSVLEAVMPVVSRHLGEFAYRPEPSGEPNPDRFHDLWLVDQVRRVEYEFHGRHNGTAFHMAKAWLGANKDRPYWIGWIEFLFTGVLLTIQLPMPISGRIVLTRVQGDLKSRILEMVVRRRGYHRVLFDDVSFSVVFKVYATQSDDARRLLTPELRTGLVQLATLSSGLARRAYLRAAIDGGEFLVTLPGHGRLFEVGGLHRPVDRLQAEIGRLLADLAIPHRVIDLLFDGRSDQAAVSDVR